jgi:hypothetical protein
VNIYSLVFKVNFLTFPTPFFQMGDVSSNKIIYVSILLFFCILEMNAQTSFSLNYLYIGDKNKYGAGISKDLVHHGIGVQMLLLD